MRGVFFGHAVPVPQGIFTNFGGSDVRRQLNLLGDSRRPGAMVDYAACSMGCLAKSYTCRLDAAAGPPHNSRQEIAVASSSG